MNMTVITPRPKWMKTVVIISRPQYRQ